MRYNFQPCQLNYIEYILWSLTRWIGYLETNSSKYWSQTTWGVFYVIQTNILVISIISSCALQGDKGQCQSNLDSFSGPDVTHIKLTVGHGCCGSQSVAIYLQLTYAQQVVQVNVVNCEVAGLNPNPWDNKTGITCIKIIVTVMVCVHFAQNSSTWWMHNWTLNLSMTQ